MKVLVSGSGGLIGSESCRFFLDKNLEVEGLDNNMRRYFFGEKGDTTSNLGFLSRNYNKFKNTAVDIRNRQQLTDYFKDNAPYDLIIHTAAQPSHDWAAREPFTDFDVNANGTLNMLEAFRIYSPNATFIFTSTNKVYGDNPNYVNLTEEEKRYEYSETQEKKGVSIEGISEEMSIDHCKHSIFGASKAAADLMSQEYGRYFNLNVGIFRGGCLTGPQHSAVELHGFLAYIVDCAVNKKPYRIFGYRGKQVRDQIHSNDVVNAFWHFHQNPKKGEAYNLGGCKHNSASVLEVIDILKKDFGLKLDYEILPENRIGDHICYYSDMGKFKKDFPNWMIKKGLHEIIQEIVERKKL
jgi:CDP-paratose 2-epimerase